MDTANNAVDHLLFTFFACEALVRPETVFRDEVRVHTGGPGMLIRRFFAPDGVRGRVWNLQISAVAIAVQAMDRALDATFGGKAFMARQPVLPLDDRQSAQVIVFMLRCAFAHDPFRPRWSCRGPYVGRFSVGSIGVALNTRRLDGDDLVPEQFGGFEGLVKLLIFCRDEIIAHASPSPGASAASVAEEQEGD